MPGHRLKMFQGNVYLLYLCFLWVRRKADHNFTTLFDHSFFLLLPSPFGMYCTSFMSDLSSDGSELFDY
ncbi:hypothetical protein I7I48_06353 [Histoplasma ohiense]|nr:hypothetical protein I7I48_06353 [Histoplasma ohiense (nom. inval.)]